MAIGIIAGTILLGMEFLSGEEREVQTKYGKVSILSGKDVILIPRHGTAHNIPPHRINHRANISAMKDLKVEKIIGVGSVGSLKKSIRKGSIVVPDDYINLWDIATFYDESTIHITPSLDEKLRKKSLHVAKKLGIDVIPKAVYVQTHGPRLETKAEINLLKDYADIVGMSMASEATLAKELNLKYSAICMVDNYAHGVVKEELDIQKAIREASKKRENLKKLVMGVVEELR